MEEITWVWLGVWTGAVYFTVRFLCGILEYDRNNNKIKETLSLRNGMREKGMIKFLNFLNRKKKFRWEFDSKNNMTKENNTDGSFRTWEYDSNNNKTKETDSDGSFRTWEYDKNNKLTKETDSDGTTHTYEYDSKGHRLHEKKPKKIETKEEPEKVKAVEEPKEIPKSRFEVLEME